RAVRLAGTGPEVEEVDGGSWTEPALRRWLADTAHRPFDLTEGPLVRLVCVGRGESDVLLLSLHHIVGDLWSRCLLLWDLALAYGAEAARPGASRDRLGAPPPPFADHVSRLRRRLSGGEGERLEAFWRAQLEAFLEPLRLPTDRPRPPVQTYRGAARRATWGRGLVACIEALGRGRSTTLFTVLLALFQVLLHRLSGQERLVVGAPVAGRTRPESAGTVGYFVNPLPLPSHLVGDPSFTDLLDRARRRVIAALDHQEFPFSRLTERLQPERDASFPPIFQVFFSLQSPPSVVPGEVASLASGEDGAAIELGPLQLAGIGLETRASPFDLALTAAPSSVEPGGLAVALTYNPDLFDATTVERFARALRTLAQRLTADPGAGTSSASLLTASEEAQVLRQWNDVATGPEVEGGLLQELSRLAERVPDRVAVVQGSAHLTYAQLTRRAVATACCLRARGIGVEDRVAVYLEPSPSLVVGLLGVWYAGAAYVPLAPSYPMERLLAMVEDSSPAVLLTAPELLASAPPGPPPLFVDDMAEAPPGPRSPLLSSGQLAYVLFTSGSTGRPKGVQIPHRAVENFLAAMTEKPGLDGHEALLSITPLSFDISVLEIFLPLLLGRRVVLSSRQSAGDARELLSLLARSRAGVLQATPATWRILLDSGWRPAPRFLCLCGGESMDRGLAGRMRTDTAELWNLYGPTETTVWSAIQRVEAEPRGATVPIGRPVRCTAVYVVDSRGRPVPIGVAGELWLGGAGVARGYAGRPAATAEAFVPDPFGAGTGARAYRTGDRVLFLADGSLEYLGRADRQVKVRGHRIELGEIETAVAQQPSVREAAVLAREDPAGGLRLVAYVVAGTEEPPPVSDLRRGIADGLPEPMVPSTFVFLDALPRTPNGKIDRCRLPPVEESLVRTDGSSPLGPREEIVAGLFRDILGVPEVGRGDDFFALGGHSLSAARLVAHLRSSLRVELPLPVVFQTPTVAGLAAAVDRVAGEGPPRPPLPPLRRIADRREAPLTLGQRRLWLFQRLNPRSNAYVMAAALDAVGPVDASFLGRALRTIVRRHAILWTRYVDRSGDAVQVVDAAAPLGLPWIDLRGLPAVRRPVEAERLERAHAAEPFDLERGPVLRVRVVALGETGHCLLLGVHHIAADAASFDLFAAEFAAAYRSLQRGERLGLAAPPVQYADYAVWQRSLEAHLEGDLRAWELRLGTAATAELPGDRPRPAVPSYRGGIVRSRLNEETTALLDAACRRLGATRFMALTAVLQALLASYTGSLESAVGAPVGDRTEPELEGVIGYFVNPLPLRADLSDRPGFDTLVRRARDEVFFAHAHRHVPVEALLARLEGARDLGSALFQVALVERGELPDIKFPDLVLRPRELHGGGARFDLSLFATRRRDDEELSWEYSWDCFDRVTVRRFAAHFGTLARRAAAEPERPLSTLSFLARGERTQILHEWNDNALRDVDATVPDRFLERARLAPDALAVACGERHVSYGELAHRSAGVGARLRDRGVGCGSVVALWMSPSDHWVVAALGVLRAGAAYLPLDVGLPSGRVAEIVKRASVRVVVRDETAEG
ncbi:MAG TPA: amino acid adenylation domain-containing protein, partial [Candidatus Limnocylindrales bacterium]|nr:amino acid adenylation domain-containing protein [Candidatus Limnocylindrales bacterium]